ncbi:MAG: heme exporter protein CcmD [Pseudomonadota bacterium]
MTALGQYAGEVLAAYAGTLVLLGAIVGITVVRARRVKRLLAEAEARDG